MKTTRPTITYQENTRLIIKKLYFWNKEKILNKIFQHQETTPPSKCLLKRIITNKFFCSNQEEVYTFSKYNYIKIQNYHFKDKITFRCNPNNGHLILENCIFKSLNLDSGYNIEVINT